MKLTLPLWQKIILTIDKLGSCSQSDITRELKILFPVISNTVHLLVEKGIVSKKREGRVAILHVKNKELVKNIQNINEVIK